MLAGAGIASLGAAGLLLATAAVAEVQTTDAGRRAPNQQPPRARSDDRSSPAKPQFSLLETLLDAQVPDWLADENIPGAVLAVGHKTADGFDTWSKAYGFLRIEPQKVPMPVDAVFDMASITKPVATGSSLALLIQRGAVHLNDPVGKYLPEFTSGDKAGITVRQLVTHTSDLPPYVDAADQEVIKNKAGFPCADATRACIRNLAPQHEPGKFTYSCLNAILCAEIVERVSGKSLDAFAHEHVFAPLEMRDTGYIPAGSFGPSDAEGRAQRFVPSTRADRAAAADGFLAGEVHDPLAAMQGGVSGNAGLFSTAADLARFAQMMLGEGELDGVRIFEPATVAELTRIQNPGALNASGEPAPRGLLWEIYPAEHERDYAYGHTGYTGTAIRIYPRRGLYLIALTNRVHPDDSSKVEEFRRRFWETMLKSIPVE